MSSREKRRMSSCEGGKGLDLLAVVLYKWKAMNTKGGKTIQLGLWLAGAPRQLFRRFD
jgi:hypothetical protein